MGRLDQTEFRDGYHVQELQQEHKKAKQRGGVVALHDDGSISRQSGSRFLAYTAPSLGERRWAKRLFDISTLLFADVPVDMTPEELEISASTPNFRLAQKA